MGPVRPVRPFHSHRSTNSESRTNHLNKDGPPCPWLPVDLLVVAYYCGHTAMTASQGSCGDAPARHGEVYFRHGTTITFLHTAETQ